MKTQPFIRTLFLRYLCLVFFIPIAPVAASEDIFESLQNDLAKYEKIATDTRQNVDYMPYVVSVLSGDELLKLGVTNLRDALELLPGVDLAVGMAGVRNAIFRGSNPFAYGQSKLVIDGSIVNDQLFGGYNQYLDLPVQLIHRIEVVRGAGSLLSHINGYSGSVHVITKSNRDDQEQTDNQVFAAVGSDQHGMAGFVLSKQFKQGKFSADFIAQKHEMESEPLTDRFGKTGVADQELENYNLGLSAQYNSLDIKGRFAKNDSGASYGQAFSLSDDPDDELSIDNNVVDIRYYFDLAQDVKGHFRLGYLDETRTLQNKVMPDGSMMGMLPNGRYFLVDYEEQTFREGVELDISRFDDHKVTIGVLWEQSQVEENIGRISDNNLSSFNTFPLLLRTDRDHFSFYFDDLWNINEKLTVQFGLRFDDYDDVEEEISPRLAMVYRYDDNNIYKLMFTESFREPSWREQYLNAPAFYKPNLNLLSEKVRAYEAAYIRHLGKDESFKINAFLLENSDQIHAQNATKTFNNQPDSELWGLEMEYQTPVGINGKFNINYSFVDGDNVDNKLANSTQQMLKAYYSHNLTSQLSVSGVFKYIGEKQRIPSDNRQDVDQYMTLDLATQYEFTDQNVLLNVSVKNVFDEKYYFPSPADTYPTDFEQQGRQLMVSIRMGF